MYAIKALLCVLVTYGEPFVPKISIVSGKTQLLVNINMVESLLNKRETGSS